MLLHKELIKVGASYTSQEEALRSIAQGFVDEGLCKDTFPDALVEREASYPTGLPAALDIAIPHCAASNVNTTSMACVTLKEPVEFHEMGDPNSVVHPRIIFMLAIKDPDKQIETLQKLMSVIQDADLLNNILDATSQEDVYTLLAHKVGE